MSGLEPGTTLGGYEILARLRAGAMGVLYLARRVGPKGFMRPVAIKVIHDHLAQNKRFCRMFIDEAKLSAQIDDPNVVRVEEFGREGDRYYLVMEYVHGVSLAQALGVLRAAGGMPTDHAVAIALQICGGLHGAHEATGDDGAPLGIVHRDVSPHNVLVSYRGHVRVIDFGIAKARQTSGQTKTGSLRGKLAYMPPEQARSARTVDRRADVYCVGLILWEMLTGRRLFDADNDIAMLNQIRNPVIVPPSTIAQGTPRALDAVIMQTLEQDPDKRPPTAADLQRALGDAHPAALRILPADLGALMTKVRTLATSLAHGDEDPSGLYGDEVRRTLTLFGKSMHESVELADGARPSVHDIGNIDDETEAMVRTAPSSIDPSPSVVIEDETTHQRRAPVKPRMPSGHTLQLASNVPLPPPPPQMSTPAPRSTPSPTRDYTVGLAIGLPSAAAILGAALIIVSTRKPAPPARIDMPPVEVVTTATTVPPVIVPPPRVIEPEPTPTPTPTVIPRGVSALERAREAARDGRVNEVRQLLEARVRGGHGSLDEARLVKAACKQMADTACREDIVAKYPALTGNF